MKKIWLQINQIEIPFEGRSIFFRLAFLAFTTLIFSTVAHADKLYVEPGADGATATVFIDCQVNGNQEKCQLDMGSAFAVMSAPINSLQNAPIVGHADEMGQDSIASTCDLVSVNDMKIGSRDISSQVVRRCPGFLTKLSPNIGNAAFNGKTFILDFPHQKLIWSRPEDLKIKAKNNFHRDPLNGWITIDAKIGEQKMTAFFDSGSQISIIDEKYVAAHSDRFILLGEEDATDSSGHIIKEKVYATEAISIDGKILTANGSNMVIATDFGYIQNILGPQVHFVLGMTAIKELTWFFDFENLRWGVSKVL